ncbi:MAG: hypothetical protein HYU34_03350 [Candidatus Omnitrophica bacterium]|nr:hypothetical protein [Candidatus Omnitrophota bacterium]
MKTMKFAVVAALVSLVSAGNVWALEGATKTVAALAQPEQGRSQPGPILLVSSSQLSPTKPVQAFLWRIPQPTLSAERIREEKPGRSFGTKAAVLFQEGN